MWLRANFNFKTYNIEMAKLFKDLGNPTLHLDTKQHRVKALEQYQLLLEAKKTATNV